MSGCINDSGEVTPNGKHISQGRQGHNVSWSYIDTIIDNPFRDAVQPDGRKIYVYRQPSRTKYYSIVVLESDDCAVTAIKDLRPNDLTAMAAVITGED